MLELHEFQEPKLLTDLKKFKNLMLVLNAAYLISEKLVMSISHISLNAKPQLLAQFY